MTTIELLRHAKAHSRDEWWGRPDRQRPLVQAGWRQAAALVDELSAGSPIGGVYSSPFVRCTQTVQPLAAHLDQPLHETDALGEAMTLPVHDGGDAWVTSAWLAGRAVAFITNTIERHPGSRVVLCSHGDVIPAVMALLVGRDGLELTDLRCKKGARFTLDFDGSRCVAAHLHPPPVPEGSRS